MNDELNWKLFLDKKSNLMQDGFKNKKIGFYNSYMLEKLRKVYYGGIPASIILLSNTICNGYCYDRALLMASAFLKDDDVDVKLIDGSINSIKLNPKFICDDPMYSDHCFVEITFSTGEQLIIDTSLGLIFDKELYWKIENPVIRKINYKQDIIKYLEETKEVCFDINDCKNSAVLIIPYFEKFCKLPSEKYANPKILMLQKEIQRFKKEIDYNSIIRKMKNDKRYSKNDSSSLKRIFKII